METQLTIPETIPFSSIVWELEHQPRERKVYNGIESLADSIRERGTETPIVLSPLADGGWLLEAGGRRYTALKTLGVDTVYYGSVSEPGRPGFVVKNRITTTEDHSLTELIENLHRESLDWRDEVRLIVRAWRAKKREAALSGAEIFYSTFGRMLGGYGHSDINAALRVHDRLVSDPEFFAKSSSILQAYQKMLDESKAAMEKELVSRTMAFGKPAGPKNLLDLCEGRGGVSGQPIDFVGNVESEPNLNILEIPKVDLSFRFKLGNSLDWMLVMRSEGQQFDHIICDPDFAVTTERLEAGVSGASAGVAQTSIQDSLADLKLFLEVAFDLTRNYCIFWYDLDHHEKLQSWATAVGFRVQRWPIIWHKTDYRSNASPQHNFCKNIEYAMVCAKPSATLATVQMSSVIALPSGQTTKDFGHPFAKPPLLWEKLYTAVATPGQTTFDPFMGRGSSTVGALRFGLQPSGGELSESHFNGAILNIQGEYKKTLGSNVVFQ